MTRGLVLTDAEREILVEQLQEQRASLPKRLPGIETISKEEFDKFTLLSAEPLERGRGRPPVGASNDQSTEDSFSAFLLVQIELNAFRKKIGKKRVPDEATDEFIQFAIEQCPDADPEIVREYIRKNNGMNIPEEFKARNWRD